MITGTGQQDLVVRRQPPRVWREEELRSLLDDVASGFGDTIGAEQRDFASSLNSRASLDASFLSYSSAQLHSDDPILLRRTISQLQVSLQKANSVSDGLLEELNVCTQKAEASERAQRFAASLLHERVYLHLFYLIFQGRNYFASSSERKGFQFGGVKGPPSSRG